MVDWLIDWLIGWLVYFWSLNCLMEWSIDRSIDWLIWCTLTDFCFFSSYALHHQEWSIKLQHYAVKFMAACLTAPMYAAAVQLTVQTMRGRESWNALEFLKLVAKRYTVWQAPGSGHPLKRTMPVWIIAPLVGFILKNLLCPYYFADWLYSWNFPDFFSILDFFSNFFLSSRFFWIFFLNSLVRRIRGSASSCCFLRSVATVYLDEASQRATRPDDSPWRNWPSEERCRFHLDKDFFLPFFILKSSVDFFSSQKWAIIPVDLFQITSAYLQTTNISIASSTKGTIGNIFRRYLARAVALVCADLLLYPLETVLNRYVLLFAWVFCLSVHSRRVTLIAPFFRSKKMEKNQENLIQSIDKKWLKFWKNGNKMK